jgi:hypothetical protein
MNAEDLCLLKLGPRVATGMSPILGELKPSALFHELGRISVDDFVDEVGVVAAAAHFQGGFGDGEGVADAPVAGAVHPDSLVAIEL